MFLGSSLLICAASDGPPSINALLQAFARGSSRTAPTPAARNRMPTRVEGRHIEPLIIGKREIANVMGVSIDHWATFVGDERSGATDW